MILSLISSSLTYAKRDEGGSANSKIYGSNLGRLTVVSTFTRWGETKDRNLGLTKREYDFSRALVRVSGFLTSRISPLGVCNPEVWIPARTIELKQERSGILPALITWLLIDNSRSWGLYWAY